jgi:hypothetical protein
MFSQARKPPSLKAYRRKKKESIGEAAKIASGLWLASGLRPR